MKDATTVGKNAESWQLTFANRSGFKYKFTNTKELVKKLARIETSSICRQQFANCLSCEGRFKDSKTEFLAPIRYDEHLFYIGVSPEQSFLSTIITNYDD